MPNLEREFTSFEAAKACGVFHTTLIGWVNRGHLKARYTPGGHRRIALSDLIEFMRKHEIPIPDNLASKPLKILVVEDDDANQKMLTRILRTLPQAQVQACSGGLEALIFIGKEAPDLLVLDVYIPEINGVSVCKLLKSNPHTHPVKILAISGQPLAAKEETLVRKYADAYVRKPFDVAKLKALAANLLGLRLSAAEIGR